MKRERSNGFLLIIAGIVLGVVGANADEFGLGVPGFGWEQGVATSLGALAIIYGTYLTKLDARLLIAAGLIITAFTLIVDKLGLGAPGIHCPQGNAILVGIAIFLIGASSLKAKA